MEDRQDHNPSFFGAKVNAVRKALRNNAANLPVSHWILLRLSSCQRDTSLNLRDELRA